MSTALVASEHTYPAIKKRRASASRLYAVPHLFRQPRPDLSLPDSLLYARVNSPFSFSTLSPGG